MEEYANSRLKLVFLLAGLAFKFGGVPFHMWVPDVYEGAPTCVTLFISTAPKIAAAGMALRLLMEALPGLVIQWQQILIVVSVLSMVVRLTLNDYWRILPLPRLAIFCLVLSQQRRQVILQRPFT